MTVGQPGMSSPHSDFESSTAVPGGIFLLSSGFVEDYAPLEHVGLTVEH